MLCNLRHAGAMLDCNNTLLNPQEDGSRWSEPVQWRSARFHASCKIHRRRCLLRNRSESAAACGQCRGLSSNVRLAICGGAQPRQGPNKALRSRNVHYLHGGGAWEYGGKFGFRRHSAQQAQKSLTLGDLLICRKGSGAMQRQVCLPGSRC